MSALEIPRLQAADYVVFSIMLLVSASIGLFYACTGGKQKTTNEYLMANRQMGILPVTLSLLASFMSAITLLGTPGEMYQYGTQYWMIGPSYIIVCFVSAHVLLPCFYRLHLTSAYEYLEMRFNKVVRFQGCCTFLVQMIVYMGIVLYAPALAINAVTGLNWVMSILVLGIVCTFYTTIGGMKAVMWTDVFQITIMFGGMLAVVIKGTIESGGIHRVWEILENTSRVELLNFDPNPLVRHTVWTTVIGGAFTWIVIYGINQSQVQRYLTTKNMRSAQIAIWLNLPGLWGLLTICALGGLVAFAYFYQLGCDPLTAKYISKSDQILPLFVMVVLNYPGFPGLFIATIFSGALSTVSSGVNALAAVTLEDLVKPYCLCCFKTNRFSDFQYTVMSKSLALFYGLLAVALAFVASKMGDVLQAALGLFGMVGGPLLGICLLGMMFPFANWQGAFVGHLVGEVMSLWVGFGSYLYKYPLYKPPVNVESCPFPYNETSTAGKYEAAVANYDGLAIYRLSYMYQAVWSVLWTLIVGILVSIVTGGNKKPLNAHLITPVGEKICCCIPQSVKDLFNHGVTYTESTENGAINKPEALEIPTIPNTGISPPSEKFGYTNPVAFN